MHAALQDRDMSTEDKVKVVRYAWSQQGIHWPNKEQSLLNWLSESLNVANRKKLSDKDLMLVWRSLHDILHTTRCHKPSNTGQSLMLKHSLMQLILNELGNHALAKVSSCSNCDVIIACCLRILTSPVLGHVWSSRLESMLQLLHSSILLCFRKSNVNELSPTILQLLGTSNQFYLVVYQQSSQAIQTFQQTSQKLFLPLASLLQTSTTCRGDLKDQLHRTSVEVMKTVLKLLVPKELLSYYELYLKLKVTNVDIDSVPPKLLEGFFRQLIENVQEPADYQAGILEMLPHLYRSFIDSYRGHEVCFQLCQHLVEILNLVPAKGTVAMAPLTTITTAQKLLTLDSLLEVMIQEDVYDLADDHLHDNKQLSWLQKLTRHITNISAADQTDKWYTIQSRLLHLNHVTVESNISAFLQKAWLESESLNEASSTCQSRLLSEVVALYTRLRQLPRLFTKLMQVLRENTVRSHVTLPIQVENSIAESLTSQPPTVILEIWEGLVSELHSNYIDECISGPAIQLICSVLRLVLIHARLADYSITHQVAAKVQKLMAHTRDDILKPLVLSLNKKPLISETPVILQLVHSWGQLHLSLEKFSLHYASQTTDAIKGPEIEPALDLTIVHDYIPYKTWAAIGTKIQISGKPSGRYLWMKLLVQQLRKLMCQSTSASVVTSVEVIVNQFFLHLPEGSMKHTNVWDQKAVDVDEDTLSVAVWAELCQVLPLVEMYLNSKQRQLFACHFVSALQDQSCVQTSHCVSRKGVALGFVHSGALWESNAIMTAILNNIWSSVAEILDSQQTHKGKSPKKKKKMSISGNVTAGSIVKQLLEMHGSDRLQEVCSRLSELPANVGLSEANVEAISKTETMIVILQELPLEMLSPANQNMSILATIAVLWTTPLHANTQSLLEKCLHLLHILYSSIEGKAFDMKNLGMELVINWIRSKSSAGTEKLDSICLPLYASLLQMSFWNNHMAFVEANVKQDVEAFSEDPCSPWTIRLLMCTLQHVIKVLRKPYIKKEVRVNLGQIRDILQPWVLALVTTHLNGELCHDNLSADTQAWAIEAFSHQLGYLMKVKGEGTDSFLNHVVLVSQNCTGLLRGDKTPTPAVLDSCLAFISMVCRSSSKETNLDQTVEEEKKDPEGTDSEDDPEIDEDGTQKQLPELGTFMLDSWRSLVNILYTLPADDGQGHSKVAQYQDVEAKNEAASSVLLRKKVEQALSNLVGVSSAEQCSVWVHELLESVTVEVGLQDPDRAAVSLEVWNILLTINAENEKLRELTNACQKLVLQLQQLLTEVSHSWDNRYHTLVVMAVKTQTALVSWGQGLFSSQCNSIMLYSCYKVPLKDLSHGQFVAHFTAVQSLLREVLAYHKETVCARIPAYCMGLRHLVASLVWSGRQRDTEVPEAQVDQLVVCAQQMSRHFNLIRDNSKDFSKVAAYVVADYADVAQKVTVLPRVKKALLDGIYQCLDMCDDHAVALLHTALAPGVKDIFRVLYSEYTKYHKYTGRV